MGLWRSVFGPFLLALAVGVTVGPLLGGLMSFVFDFIEETLPKMRADPVIVGTAVLVFLVTLIAGVWQGRRRPEEETEEDE